MIEFRKTDLEDVIEIFPRRIADHRGFFSETYNRATLQEIGIETDFVQDNHSLSRNAGVLRGLHYQAMPHPQAKLVRVLKGAIFDVAVDLRRSSPTFRKWVGIEISADKWNQLFIPVGFGHGFLTLQPDTEVAYKTSALYAPACDRSVRFDDPEIGVDWPIRDLAVTLSPKDEQAPALRDAEIFD